MSSLRKKVSALGDEVGFLRDLIDTGWDTSQDQLRLRVRQGPITLVGDDVLVSMTTTPDANCSDDGGQSVTNFKRRRACPTGYVAQDTFEEELKDTGTSTIDEGQFPRFGLDIQGPAHQKPIPYDTRHIQHVHPHLPPDLLFDRADLRGQKPIPPPLLPPADILPQPFFEQYCALLDTGHALPSLVGNFSERLDDHITILAVTRGWAEVFRTVALDPQWQVLRQIAGYFSFMRPVDRLASLRIMRLLMKVCTLLHDTVHD